jgi:hypothetical protein
VDGFLGEYRGRNVTEARHALEHEEERVSGIDLQRGSPPYAGEEAPFPVSTGYTAATGRLTSLRVLNEHFDIARVIDGAIALEEPLRRYAATDIDISPTP